MLRSCDLHPDLDAQASTGPWSEARRRLSIAELRCVRVHLGLPCDCQWVVARPLLTNDLVVMINLFTLAGRVISFFKCAVGPGLHSERSDVRSMTYVDEYWRLPPQSGDLPCSGFGCARLYSTIPKVYYVIDTWCILGLAPMMSNPVHPTIPHGTLPKSQAQRKWDHPEAKKDSKNGGDGSPQWMVNMWAMMWGLKRPTPGEQCNSMWWVVSRSGLFVTSCNSIHNMCLLFTG